MSQIEELLQIMQQLRDPETGCPWDLRQTYRTIIPHTVEEVYEVVDAIENNQLDELPEELGDLLFQIVFYAQLGAEQNHFTFDDVVAAICRKLVDRHPHVFAGEKVDEVDLNAQWEAKKQAEREAKGNALTSLMENIPINLPALTRAAKIQGRAARVGFDWQTIEPVWEKLKEEVGEIHEAIDQQMGKEKIEDELGDLLCVCVNLARHLDVDPEQALRRSNNKFERRFRYIESALAEKGSDPDQATLEEMDALWDEAKLQERSYK